LYALWLLKEILKTSYKVENLKSSKNEKNCWVGKWMVGSQTWFEGLLFAAQSKKQG
jgi:hypothetical protein